MGTWRFKLILQIYPNPTQEQWTWFVSLVYLFLRGWLNFKFCVFWLKTLVLISQNNDMMCVLFCPLLEPLRSPKVSTVQNLGVGPCTSPGLETWGENMLGSLLRVSANTAVPLASMLPTSYRRASQWAVNLFPSSQDVTVFGDGSSRRFCGWALIQWQVSF